MEEVEALSEEAEKGERQEQEKKEKKRRWSEEEKKEAVRMVDALVRGGFTVREACSKAGIEKSTYYKWKQELGGEQVEQQKEQKDKDEVKDAYAFLEKYGIKRVDAADAATDATKSVVEEVERMKKQLDRLRVLLSDNEGGVSAVSSRGSVSNGSSEENNKLSEELKEIKETLAQIQRDVRQSNVYFGRIRKVKHPDGTEIEYDYAPRDYATVKQADMMCDRAIPSAISELKGLRSDLTMFASRLLGLIETNLSHEIKKVPGFFAARRRTKEEREKELEKIDRRLRKEISIKVEEEAEKAEEAEEAEEEAEIEIEGEGSEGPEEGERAEGPESVEREEEVASQ